MNNEKITNTWRQFQDGISYKDQLNYKSKGDKCEKYYAGDQTDGVNNKILPIIPLNVLKPNLDKMVSFILSKQMRIRYIGFSPEFLNVTKNEIDDTDYSEFVYKDKFLDGVAKEIWDRNKMSLKLTQQLITAGKWGNYCFHTYFDMKVLGYDSLYQGDIVTETIHPINVFFGDANCWDINKQPYIIIRGRAPIEQLQLEAKVNGVNVEILGDNDTENGAGELSSIENTTKKATYLIKYYMKNISKTKTPKYTVWCEKSVKNAVIRSFDTKLSRYPITWGYWTMRDSSYLGESQMWQWIPGQVFINKQLSLAAVSSQNTAFPKLIYDKLRISAMSNGVGMQIGVNGDVTGAATYLQGASMDGSAVTLPMTLINEIQALNSLTGAVLGTERPENTSALLLMTGNATKNYDIISNDLYRVLEELGEIWLDFIKTKYSNRIIYYETEQGMEAFELNSKYLKKAVLKTKIDVTEANDLTDTDIINNISNMAMNGTFPVELLLDELNQFGYFTKDTIKKAKEWLKSKQVAEQPTGQGVSMM